MRISPKYDVAGGVGDLWNELRRPQPYRWPILLASCAFPAFFLYFFAQERVYAPPATPDIVYITSFAPDRSEDEIIASNIANQERKAGAARLGPQVAPGAPRVPKVDARVPKVAPRATRGSRSRPEGLRGRSQPEGLRGRPRPEGPTGRSWPEGLQGQVLA